MTTSPHPSDLIYLDHNATTPISPRALDAMTGAYRDGWGNAGSVEHARGQRAGDQLDNARTQIADSISARPDEIIFTSGATEANNLAIQGAARFRQQNEDKSRVIVAATEHKCVLEAAKHSGLQADICSVLPGGDLDLDHLDHLLAGDDVALASIMMVNNETGVIQNITQISALCQKHDVKLHTDAAQALGKTAVDVGALGVDFLSLSAHKAYGPMGVGALYVRRRPRARLAPLLFGGGQERGLRSGTVPVPLAVGFGEAAAQAVELLDSEHARLSLLQSDFEAKVLCAFNDVTIKNHGPTRVANTINISFEHLEYKRLFSYCTNRFAISSGSACSSAEVEPSYVLTAMGLTPNLARNTLRIGMGRGTTAAHMNALFETLMELK